MIFDAFKLALASIWQHKARAILTILGIVIGVSSVVIFMAVGEGLRQDVNKEITALGTNVVTIVPGEFDPSGGSISTNAISGDILKLEDAEDIAALNGVEAVAPYMLAGGVLRRDTTVAPTAILFGTTTPILQTLSTIEIDEGRMFTEAENQAKDRFIVLGPQIAETLFGDESVIGETVHIGKEPFEVIGTTKTPESASVLGNVDYGSIAMIPIQTAGDITGGVKVMRLVITLDEGVDAKAFVPTIEQAMLTRHSLEDFSVLTQEDLLGTVDTILNLLTVAITGIASISLVVAGVGIMNIMLVSVTERTREIGLRKAVGATTVAILWQFLIEAIVLCVFGALVAVGVAVGVARLMAAVSPLTPVVTPEAITLAVGVGVAVGLIFGLAPAYRAARLDPIKALKYE